MKKLFLLLFIVSCMQAYTVPPSNSERSECLSDLDCPILDCFTYPCGTLECEDNKCVLKEPEEICVVGGCSGQLCISIYEDGVTTCEWKSEYGCYAEYGSCALIDGKCQWEPTDDLKACIRDRT
ncbi:unnamed protein product [Blepharisma stoltei]|uniref:Uncharacterized protein n=1 Tax=Blepharisma stoltei TaxID=1481888 RepID=A0AAU9JMS8_9CILI|nr:unnamed protein product [Blepharisma stoltei]